ncbi:MAG: DUF4124 domain-containing protein [Burkholderiales bacterium]|jgi:hypothetical protein|nr:DUF4124 domain-containing protein [Betaproteobacteria bacterium]
MKTPASPTGFSSALLFILFLAPIGSAQAAFKCQGADGKIEYSDRPCDTTKNTLDKPNTNKGVQSKPIAVPMEQLQKLFADFEPRLCEREALAAELDRAGRSGEITKAPLAWRSKQDKLIELNDIMVEFKLRAGKITKPAGNGSAETAALRKFQAGLKTCVQRGVIQSSTVPTAATAPAAAPTAAKPAAK